LWWGASWGCCYQREGTIITEMVAAELGEEAISKREGNLSADEKAIDYSGAGVDSEKEEIGLKGVRQWLDKTLRFRDGLAGAPVMGTKFYANVLDFGGGLGLAISTDGVGTKVLVARMMQKYDTVGIDCIAMNVNDILCVGAEPIAFVDYLAVREIDAKMMEQIAEGLHAGAEIARVSVPGGETAQVPDLLADDGLPGVPFDLAGTAVGTVRPDQLISGSDIVPDDIIVALASSGIHSNGVTLARRVLFEKAKLNVDSHVGELGRTVGEELLEPTVIYVPQVMAMLEAGIHIKGLAHITGDGLLNLARLEAAVGFVIDDLPEPPPIFPLIQRLGGIEDAEMYRVFNMGIGFCVVVSEAEMPKLLEVCAKCHMPAEPIGHTTQAFQHEVHIKRKGLVGRGGRFGKL
jgi:phosphoribosylformylglycinamidine cyclo-ligase